MKTLFVNAVIYAPQPIQADAFAVCDGKIVEVGWRTRLLPLRRRGYEVVDLKKKTVLPGFVDAHLHLLGTGLSLMEVNLQGVSSLEKAGTILSVAARKLPSGAWLLGRGWNKNLWGGSFPDKSFLDRVCPDNPVHLYSQDGHALWVNSLALKLTGIGKSTVAPAGGEIRRYKNGEPSGILLENACQLVTSRIPEPSEEQKMQALRRAMNHLSVFGVTAVGDCDWYPRRLGLFDQAIARKVMRLRVALMLSPDDIDQVIGLGITGGFGNDFLQVAGLKLYLDGSLGSQTAWLFSPYESNSTNFGIPCLSTEQLEMYFEKTHLARIPLAVHAIGDKANAQALEFFGNKRAVSRKLGLKHRIEHAQLLREADIGKFKKFDVGASMQPVHIIDDRDVADRHWGKRAKWAYPLASLVKFGALVGFGSDSPIASPNPLLGIYAAVCRKAPGDSRPPWYPQQSLTLSQALHAYTAGAAELCGWKGKCGEIHQGRWADFVVLSDDIFRVGLEEIPRAKVIATYIAGQPVYQDVATL